MKKAFGLILLALIIMPTMAADYDLDYAVFRGSAGYDIVELYLLIPRQMFKFVPVEGGIFQSHAFVRAALVQQDSIIDIVEWDFVDQVKDTNQLNADQKIPDIGILQAKPGSYQLMVIVADMHTRVQKKKVRLIELPEYNQRDLAISDIQVSWQVAKTQKENRFTKYFGYDIIPNASAIFSDNNPLLYAFFEIYNLHFDKDNPDNYKIRYSIMDLNGKELSAQDWLVRRKPGSSAVEVNQVSISSLPAGIYELKVEVMDEATQQSAQKIKRFRIMRESKKQPLVAKVSIDEAQLQNMSEKELDEIFGPLKYIAKSSEIKRYNKSDLAGKRHIIAHFWDERDPDPSTLINEWKVEFESRLAYVNQQFSTPRTKGWKTDFGRVYLLYGPPDEIERYPSSLESKPYQIWHYHRVEGGVLFVFVDKTGFGQYELVHSTARNELHDSEWQRWINPSATQSSRSQFDW